MQNEPLRVDESTDVAAFQQELQRVVPQLKITIRPNLKVNGLKPPTFSICLLLLFFYLFFNRSI